MVTGALFLFLATGASAATINGAATVTTPTSGSITASQPQPSDTIFALSLPAGAACSGSTTNGGYQVYTYLIPRGTGIQNSTVSQGALSNYGLFDSSGTLVGPFNVPTNDIVPTLPIDLEWGPAVTGDSFLTQLLAAPGGAWEAGVACANASGAVTDYWDVDITFTSVPSTTDPDGFQWAWSASSGSTSTTTTPSSTTTTAAGGSATTATTTGGGATTTTTTGGTADPSSAGSSGAGGTSGGLASTGSTGSGATGALAFTGMPASVVKILGVALLGIGCGLMLLGSGGGSRRRSARNLGGSFR
ncbi:MAG: hypothetical protein ABSC90_03490 [Acidimicrobiales bacterium]